jgi:hypothetical protein
VEYEEQPAGHSKKRKTLQPEDTVTKAVKRLKVERKAVGVSILQAPCSDSRPALRDVSDSMDTSADASGTIVSTVRLSFILLFCGCEIDGYLRPGRKTG